MLDYSFLGVEKDSFKLKNNVDVTLFRRSASPVSLIITFPKGSCNDPAGKKGLHHLLEHLLLTGNKNFKGRGDVYGFVESKGGWINAFTTKDQLGLLVIFGEGNDLVDFVEFTYDLIRNPFFTEDKLKVEKKSVVQELNKELIDNNAFLDTSRDKVFFQGSSLSFPIIGLIDDINSFIVDDVIKAHESLIDSKMSIVCGGNISPTKLRNVLNKTFGIMSIPREICSDIELVGLKEVANMIKKTSDTQISVSCGFRILNPSSDEEMLFDVLSVMLGGGSNSILMRKVRNDKGLVYDIYTKNVLYRNVGVFEVLFDTSRENVENVLKIIGEEIYKLKSGDIEKSVFTSTKDRIIKMAKIKYETPYDICYNYAMWRVGGCSRGFELPQYLNKVANCSKSELQQVASKYFLSESFGISMIGDVDFKNIDVRSTLD